MSYTMQELPIEILQAKVCSNCTNYLTVLPITQLGDRKIFCGRNDCVQNKATPSLLNTLLTAFKFRCVNYLDGCKVLLESHSSKEHEEKCVFQPQECFFCSYTGNWAQLLYHMKQEHPSNLSKACQFSFQVGAVCSKTFLYLADDDIYLVSVKIHEAKLGVTIRNLNAKELFTKQIRFSYSSNHEPEDAMVEYNLFNPKIENRFESSIEALAFYFNQGTELTCRITFDPLDLSAEKLELAKKDNQLREFAKVQASGAAKTQKSLDDLSASLQHQQNNVERINAVLKKMVPTVFCCRECDEPINGDSVFFCANGHFYCKGCVPKQCKANVQTTGNYQKEHCAEFEEIRGLEQIYLVCEWDDCNQLIALPNYVGHKRNCSQRSYVCPVIKCFKTVYSSKELLGHWHSKIPIKRIDSLKSLIINDYGIYDFFWLIDDDLYKIHVSVDEKNGIVDVEAVNITFKMLPFEIDAWSKTYYAYDKRTRHSYAKRIFILNIGNAYYKNSVSKVTVPGYVLKIYPNIKGTNISPVTSGERRSKRTSHYYSDEDY